MNRLSWRQRYLAASLLGATLILLACGSASVAVRPTATISPTATATAIPPTPTFAPPTCVPDVAGVYADPYVTTLPNFDLPAPPLTKHGIGSAGTVGNLTTGGTAGMCSAGTAATLDAFYTTTLTARGWSHSAPAATLTTACTAGGASIWAGTQWWHDTSMFAWQSTGSAGTSGIFWSYSFCTTS